MAPGSDSICLEVVLICLAVKETLPIYLVDFRMGRRRRGKQLPSEDTHQFLSLPIGQNLEGQTLLQGSLGNEVSSWRAVAATKRKKRENRYWWAIRDKETG